MSSKSFKITSPYFVRNDSTERPTPSSDNLIDHSTPNSNNNENFILPNPPEITEFQHRVYSHLLLIPSGRITSYAILASQLRSSPRAVGGALRRNPYAPMVPCHRVIAANGFVGGFMGDWQKAPSGVNQNRKLELLKEEGVRFTREGKLIEREGVWFDGPREQRKD
ncbi:DNA binding methylated-DNA--cysteine S-methyltransferase [Aureobasidium pullulans]|uniref:Methylated-DNA--protein-cysteine methyltransferase n=1 Tax=Aureobasidium pullulans TaxID=5580 RepID=A0A4S9C0F7_AURPU|nr:DNA binding methylated-DNA--cysteine S-methyltransferase [Aureobasidium pullulans]